MENNSKFTKQDIQDIKNVIQEEINEFNQEQKDNIKKNISPRSAYYHGELAQKSLTDKYFCLLKLMMTIPKNRTKEQYEKYKSLFNIYFISLYIDGIKEFNSEPPFPLGILSQTQTKKFKDAMWKASAYLDDDFRKNTKITSAKLGELNAWRWLIYLFPCIERDTKKALINKNFECPKGNSMPDVKVGDEYYEITSCIKSLNPEYKGNNDKFLNAYNKKINNNGGENFEFINNIKKSKIFKEKNPNEKILHLEEFSKQRYKDIFERICAKLEKASNYKIQNSPLNLLIFQDITIKGYIFQNLFGLKWLIEENYDFLIKKVFKKIKNVFIIGEDQAPKKNPDENMKLNNKTYNYYSKLIPGEDMKLNNFGVKLNEKSIAIMKEWNIKDYFDNWKKEDYFDNWKKEDFLVMKKIQNKNSK